MPADWDARFLALAAHISTWSKDPSTKVGAVVVDPETHAIRSVGFNGFAPGADDSPELYANREYKYKHVIHAEDNAFRFLLYRATGCYLYTSFPACRDCLAIAYRSGVNRVVQPTLKIDWKSPEWIEEWKNKLGMAFDYASKYGIEMVYVNS